MLSVSLYIDYGIPQQKKPGGCIFDICTRMTWSSLYKIGGSGGSQL